jgi:hypothetical protein
MALLVGGVAQVKPAQLGVRRELGGAREVAAAVRLDLGEAEQPIAPADGIAPHPALDRVEPSRHQR